MEPVRSDVEVEIAIVKCSREAAHDLVFLDDGDLVALSGELIRDGESGHTGPDNGYCVHISLDSSDQRTWKTMA